MPRLIIKQVCAKKGVSQRELARRLKKPRENVRRYLRSGANPTFQTLAAISKALKVKIRELIKD